MVFALLAAQCVCAERYYVRQTAPGANDGSNWSHAFTSLTLALDVASPSDEIWMAEGTYRPTSDGDRGKSFSVPNSTLIFGGFAGTEDSRHQRDWRAHPTILTGDIGVHNDRTDNSYHVVRTQNDATLDGLIIEGGYADGADSDGWGGSLSGGRLWRNHHQLRIPQQLRRTGGRLVLPAGPAHGVPEHLLRE